MKAEKRTATVSMTNIYHSLNNMTRGKVSKTTSKTLQRAWFSVLKKERALMAYLSLNGREQQVDLSVVSDCAIATVR